MQTTFKKLFILFVFLAAGKRLLAQTNGETSFSKQAYIMQYPVSVNEQLTTVLIFPAPIASGGVDLGSTDIIASAIDGVSNILKIKASQANTSPTNLTVITTDGKVYSFWVSYAVNADSHPIDLRTEQQQEKILASFTDRQLTDKQIAELARHIATRKAFLNAASARSFGIIARLKGIYISSGVLFFKISLSNKTNIDYETDFMRCYIRNKERSKRTADHDEELKSIYTFYTHGKITAGKTDQQIIIAFPRFTIADQKNFVIQLFEKSGDRHLSLKINGNDIIKAESIAPITE